MEAGIEPDEPSHTNALAYDTAEKLCEVCIALIHNLKNTCLPKTEYNIILNLLNSVNSHMLLNLHIA